MALRLFIILAVLCFSQKALCEREIDPDANRNFTQIVISKGYPCTEHKVTTEDGYILTMFRIGREGAPPVYLQHGLLDSSFTWILNWPTQSLAYILYDAGYDVWMGNNRGNEYSKAHVSLDPKKKPFWQFSWDEMAEYDLPAMVQYVLTTSKHDNLTYVGHSEGTTIMFAQLSMNPSFSKNLNGFVGLGPVITVNHITNYFLKEFAKFDVVEIFVLFGDKQFFPTPTKLHTVFVDACNVCEVCCSDVIELICGPHRGAFNESRMPVMAGHEPGGTSVQNVHHWAQMVKTGIFMKYDYGLIGNRKHYHKDHPPHYDISRFPSTLPTALYSGTHDELADPTDVATLVSQLPVNTTYSRIINDYAHLDYVWALDAHTQIYNQVLTFMSSWTKK